MRGAAKTRQDRHVKRDFWERRVSEEGLARRGVGGAMRRVWDGISTHLPPGQRPLFLESATQVALEPPLNLRSTGRDRMA